MPRGLVSGGVLHATTEAAPPPCVSLGPSGTKDPLNGACRPPLVDGAPVTGEVMTPGWTAP